MKSKDDLVPQVPRLTGNRIVLRAHCENDLPDAFDMWASDDAVRYVVGAKRSKQDVWRGMLSLNGLWSFFPFGYWAIECLNTGRFAGQVGFADFKRDLDGDIPETPEAGWAVHGDFAGRGYATEAIMLALGWLDETLPQWPNSHCLIHPENAASLAVAAKAGYTPHSRTVVSDSRSLVLVRPRPKN